MSLTFIIHIQRQNFKYSQNIFQGFLKEFNWMQDIITTKVMIEKIDCIASEWPLVQIKRFCSVLSSVVFTCQK